jgi:hypothetical protein
MDYPSDSAPYGYDVFTHTEVVPKQPPLKYVWRIGPVAEKSIKTSSSRSRRARFFGSEVEVQLTADQQVELSISGEDTYGNKVEITGNTEWSSSDDSIVQVTQSGPDQATAVAVGPVGTASVTVTNDVDSDGSGDFIGSISINVVAGRMAEIEVAAGEPTDKA